MNADWTVHSETGRSFRLIHNPSGEPCFEWDRPGGLVTPAGWRKFQPSSVTSRKGVTSGPELSQLAESHYGHSDSFSQGTAHADYHDRKGWQANAYDYTQPQVYSDDWHSDSQYLLPETNHKHRPIQYSRNGNHRPSSSIIVTTRGSTSPDSSSFESNTAEINNTINRRPGRGSISDHSDAYSSSQSDDTGGHFLPGDLRGLGLEEHISSQLIPAPAARHLGHRWDPILGDFQRNLDTLARQATDPTYENPERGDEHDTLDPRYKRQAEPRRFFRVGRVFSMLWHENAGFHGTIMSQKAPGSGREYTKGKFQEPIYSSIRRMVVIKEQKGCCWCIPITTYSGQGVAKAGVDRSKHAIIYMRGTQPVTRTNEPRMTKEPLEVEPAKADQKLDPMSRLNFGKVYTVEHNVKVLPVGRITEGSLAKFSTYTKAEFCK
ncbi:hypothetical protein N7456_009404 [Penicillium angulare]|uniref:DUF6590 domain-containing protein n=1 Tax=Penicillium angulare TaxID=116970 RepID=A0A9W9F4J3_9EURO|nr:hypothetical protein N7456_009404 [Penicillium angulare]